MWCIMKVRATNIPNNQPVADRKNSPQFCAKADWGKISKDISKNSKKIPKFFTYVGQNDGEILNTLVTAGGTAVVAPIFIAGNPISKEDAETKWYSAMRQPISAAIALVFQLWVNDAFNDYMAKQASVGGWGPTYDLSAAPKANYLKKIIKLEHPEYTSEQIQAEVIKRQSLAERKVIGKFRLELKDKPIEIKELVSQDSIDSVTKKMREEIEKTYEAELKGKSAKAREKFITKKLNPQLIEERAIANIEKAIELEAKAKFNIRELATKFTSVDDAIKHMNELLTKEGTNKALTENIIERLETIKVYEQSQGQKAFSSLKNLGNTYESVLHNVKIKRLVKARTSDAQKAFSKLNKWAGIFVSLATLPFSCGLLNWAYPRVMEKLMPKLQPWIHRNDPDWTPEKAKKYGPPEKLAKSAEKVKVDKEDDDE